MCHILTFSTSQYQIFHKLEPLKLLIKDIWPLRLFQFTSNFYNICVTSSPYLEYMYIMVSTINAQLIYLKDDNKSSFFLNKEIINCLTFLLRTHRFYVRS